MGLSLRSHGISLSGQTRRHGFVIAAVLAAIPLLSCKKEPSQFDRIVASSKPVESTPPPPKDFVFPALSGMPAKDVIPTVNRAVKESPPGQEGKVDEWLKGFKFPVVTVGPTKKFASDIGSLVCRYRDKALQCSIPGKLSDKAKFLVTSSLTCINAQGAVTKKTDWASPTNAKRGEVVDLAVEEAFLTACFSEGVKIGVELLGSPCAIPFPHQVRCAGEYNTCLQACKGAEGCDQRCESNRLHCLDVCKK